MLAIKASGGEAEAAIAAAFERVAALEAKWSRFRPASEVSTGHYSAETESLLAECERWKALSQGAFDPWYSGSPDLGAVGKGAAAEEVLRILAAHRVERAVVSFGQSSLAFRGSPRPAEPWRVGIKSPWEPGRNAAVLEVWGGHVSTSGEDQQRGHIVDPRSGEPAHSDLAAVSVACADPIAAEAISTALMVLGSAGLRALSPHADFQAVLLRHDRSLIRMHEGGPMRGRLRVV
jgi:thiamine biosynthesis lipoprotein